MPQYFRSQFHSNAWPPLGGIPPLYCTGNKTPSAEFSADGKILFVVGRAIAVITSLSSIWMSDLSEPNGSIFREWACTYNSPNPEPSFNIPPTIPSSFHHFKPETKPLGVQTIPHTLHDFWLRVGRASGPHAPLTKNGPYRRHRISRSHIVLANGTLSFIFYRDWLSMTLPYASVGRRVSRTRAGHFALVPPIRKLGI